MGQEDTITNNIVMMIVVEMTEAMIIVMTMMSVSKGEISGFLQSNKAAAA